MQLHIGTSSNKQHTPPMAQNILGYESAFARAIAPDAQAFSLWKGRIALFAILKALGIGSGDEVILPGYTCIVVANAIRFSGAKPVYVDIAPGGYNIDPRRVKDAISPRTRAVLVQHTYGIPGPIYECLDLARRYHLDVIEDCAHAFGSELDCQPLGSFGRAAFFSSQWSKPYTTGLGGMAVTRDPQLAEQLKKVLQEFIQPPLPAQVRLQLQYSIYQNFYSPQRYWQAQSMLQNFGRFGLFVGSSSQGELAGDMPADHVWRLPQSQQKAGLRKLGDFREAIDHRKKITALYDQTLQAAGWCIPNRAKGAVILRYPVEVANKTELLTKARAARVELGSWFETPLHPTPLCDHAKFGYSLGKYPNAERMSERVVNLPMHRWMSEAEVERTLAFFFENSVRPV